MEQSLVGVIVSWLPMALIFGAVVLMMRPYYRQAERAIAAGRENTEAVRANGELLKAILKQLEADAARSTTPGKAD